MDYANLATEWPPVAANLGKHGIDPTKIQPLHQIVVLSRIASQRGDTNWRALASDLIEEHPLWETLAHRRRRHAQDLVDDHGGNFGMPQSEQLAKHRFAAETSSHRGNNVHVVGDTDHDICAFVIKLSVNDDPEEVENIVDLDTGEVYATGDDVKVIVTAKLRGTSVSARCMGGEVRIMKNNNAPEMNTTTEKHV